MAIRILLSVLFLVSICACSSESEKVGAQQAEVESLTPHLGSKISVQGVLKYFPQDVKSAQAWLGHEYMISDTPIRPTNVVRSEQLRDLVGEIVTIEGVWNPGKKWEPANEEIPYSRPIFPEGQVVIRGSGIEASKVLKADE